MSVAHPPIKILLATLSERDLLEPAKATAKKYHVSLEEMFSTSRSDQFVKARHDFFYQLVKEYSFSYPRAGALTGFDHTTVLNGVLKHEARIASRPA